MKVLTIASSLFLAFTLAGCTASPASNANRAAVSSPAAQPTMAPKAKDGDYDGKGSVTKFDLELGSVELDDEDIPGVMPAMRMEFLVANKADLKDLTVGDRVDFVLRHQGSSETFVSVKKVK